MLPFKVLKLRDHPLMTRKSGMRVWPPIWTTTKPDCGKVSGEIGILERAMMNDLFDTKIFLFIDYEGQHYMGSLHFDDAAFCQKVFELLRNVTGRSIAEIAELDVSDTL